MTPVEHRHTNEFWVYTRAGGRPSSGADERTKAGALAPRQHTAASQDGPPSRRLPSWQIGSRGRAHEAAPVAEGSFRAAGSMVEQLQLKEDELLRRLTGRIGCCSSSCSSRLSLTSGRAAAVERPGAGAHVH